VLASILANKMLVGNVIFERDLEGEEYDPKAKSAAVKDRNAIEKESIQTD